MSWGNYCHPKQLGALHILHGQRWSSYMSIYAVLSRQIMQQPEQRLIQGDQKIFKFNLR